MIRTYKISFEHVSAIGHPEYYQGDQPIVSPNRIPEMHWTKTERETNEHLSMLTQYKGLLKLMKRGELIRNIKVYSAMYHEPSWEDITGDVV